MNVKGPNDASQMIHEEEEGQEQEKEEEAEDEDEDEDDKEDVKATESETEDEEEDTKENGADSERRRFNMDLTTNLPTIFVLPTTRESRHFTNNLNSLTRKYFSLIRRHPDVDEDTIIHSTSGAITCGELAIVLLRNAHNRRTYRDVLTTREKKYK
jgi:hypothetical protein